MFHAKIWPILTYALVEYQHTFPLRTRVYWQLSAAHFLQIAAYFQLLNRAIAASLDTRLVRIQSPRSPLQVAYPLTSLEYINISCNNQKTQTLLS